MSNADNLFPRTFGFSPKTLSIIGRLNALMEKVLTGELSAIEYESAVTKIIDEGISAERRYQQRRWLTAMWRGGLN